MFKRIFRQHLADLLPWYVNHTLSDAENDRVAAWLNAQPHAGKQLTALKELRSAVNAQPRLAPSPAVRQQFLAQIAPVPRPARHAPRAAWVAGLIATLVLLVALWTVVQPGIALRWSVTGTGIRTYRVYRAPAGSTEFSLIGQISAQSDTWTYTFTDFTFLPRQTYTYQVEALTDNGVIAAFSPLATGHGQAVLAVQLALILVSVLAGAVAMRIFGEVARPALRTRFKSI